MTKEASKENKPAGFRALLLKPIRQWLNRRSPDSQLSTPVIQHPHSNGGGLSVTKDDMSANQHRRNNNGSDEHFKRSARNRMSLPIMQQNEFRRQAYSQLQIRGQHQPRSMGHIYLQYKGETKQANLPNELTAVDTIRALFVCAFPHMLSMEYMSQPYVKIYIYNPSCNIFYELRNIEDVRHESVLRIHQSEPTLALPPSQHYPTMRLLPPIPQQPHPLSLPHPPTSQQHHHHQQQQQQQQQLLHQQQLQHQSPIQRTPMQQTPSHQHQPQQQQQQQHIQPSHQMAPHQISPHLQIPPPKPRRMIPVLNGMNSMNNLNAMNSMNNLNGINGGMNGIYGHNGNTSMNGLQSANHHVSSNNLIYMAAAPIRRNTPSPWLPPSQI